MSTPTPNYQRLVVKIGTNSIMLDDHRVNHRKLDRLAFVLSSLQAAGHEVLLVTSGAVGVGASTLKLKTYPREIAQQQALAAVGQGALMNLYTRFFAYYSQTIAQVLLTRDVIDFPASRQNAENALEAMIDHRIIPIINENDTVAVDELHHSTRFGDNDTLSAIVAELIEADLLIILSDVDGLYTGNPDKDPEAVLLPQVHAITPEVEAMADGKGSEFASGGMETKLSAAKRMLANQAQMILMSGADPDLIFQAVQGQPIGTRFVNKEETQ